MILPNFFLVTIDLVIHVLRGALLCSSMPTACFTHCCDVNNVNISNILSKRNMSRLISSMLYCRNTREIPIINEEKQLNLFANMFNVNRIWVGNSKSKEHKCCVASIMSAGFYTRIRSGTSEERWSGSHGLTNWRARWLWYVVDICYVNWLQAEYNLLIWTYKLCACI